MALRLYPFRQYNETDVINLYAGDFDGGDTASLADPFTNGNNDNGVFVKVSNGNMSADPVAYETTSYLGKTDYPNIGRDQYPVVSLKYQAATGISATNGGDVVLGVTLRQTLTHDENGEKLLYYPQKAIEMQALLTGQACPIATKGVFTFSQVAIDKAAGTPLLVPGTRVGLQGAGLLSGYGDKAVSSFMHLGIGQVLASGTRVSDAGTTNRSDYFSMDSSDGATETGNYYVVKVDCG